MGAVGFPPDETGTGFLLLADYIASVPSIRRHPAIGEIDTLAADTQSA